MLPAILKLWAALALALVATPGLAWDGALRDAARMNDAAAVAAALAAGADPNGYDNAYSPLMFAAGNGQADTVKLLLAHGARTEHRDHNGDRALLWAAQRGHVEVVRILLDAGSPADSDDPYDITPLMQASRYGHEEVAQLLLAHGADVNRRDHTGDTALHDAALARDAPLVELLLDAGADPRAVSRILEETPLHVAAQYDQPQIVRLLSGADLEARDKEGRTALWRAAGLDHAETVGVLLEMGADPDAKAKDGVTPIVAAASGSGAAAGRLVEPTADLDAAFSALVWGGHADLARRLYERGAKVGGGSALAGAAVHPGPEMMLWLLARDPDLAAQGPAALHEAAARGRADLAVLLLDRGVAVDARAKGGSTALLRAAGAGHPAVVRLLLDRGADVSLHDAQGRDMAAYMAASEAAIEELIARREASRAWLPTEDLRAELDALRAAHAEIAALR